jgi:hypothetical protein
MSPWRFFIFSRNCLLTSKSGSKPEGGKSVDTNFLKRIECCLGIVVLVIVFVTTAFAGKPTPISQLISEVAAFFP